MNKLTDIHEKYCLRIDGCNNKDRCVLFGTCFLKLLQLNKWLTKQPFTRACTGKPDTCLYCSQEKSDKCISLVVISDLLETYGQPDHQRKLITYHIDKDNWFTSPVIDQRKLKVLYRDRVCKECGTNKHLTIDHIHPLSKGGTNELSNLQALCFRCNCFKDDKLYK